METPTHYIKYSMKLINEGGNKMNKLYTDTPIITNINQAVADDVIMVLENGEWHKGENK